MPKTTRTTEERAVEKMITLHCKVKARRQQLGMKQEELAARCNISVPSMSRLERGLSEPGVLLALRVAEILDCGLRELWPSSEKRKFEQVKLLANAGPAQDLAAAVSQDK